LGKFKVGEGREREVGNGVVEREKARGPVFIGNKGSFSSFWVSKIIILA
jgi:hypothetical protein